MGSDGQLFGDTLVGLLVQPGADGVDRRLHLIAAAARQLEEFTSRHLTSEDQTGQTQTVMLQVLVLVDGCPPSARYSTCLSVNTPPSLLARPEPAAVLAR